MKKTTKNRYFAKVIMMCGAFFVLWSFKSLKHEAHLQQEAHQHFHTEAAQTAQTAKPMQIKLQK